MCDVVGVTKGEQVTLLDELQLRYARETRSGRGGERERETGSRPLRRKSTAGGGGGEGACEGELTACSPTASQVIYSVGLQSQVLPLLYSVTPNARSNLRRIVEAAFAEHKVKRYREAKRSSSLGQRALTVENGLSL